MFLEKEQNKWNSSFVIYNNHSDWIKLIELNFISIAL